MPQRLIRLALALLCLAGPVPVLAQGLADETPLGAILPHSGEDAARVAALLDDPTAAMPDRLRPGGDATSVAAPDRDAFTHPFPNLTLDQRMDFRLGEALFDKLWVPAPASTRASDGLGPLYNARSCASCHIRDGRGHPPDDRGAVSMFLRVGVPTDPSAEMALIEGYLATAPDPTYGRQIQDHALQGLPAEAQVAVTWQTHAVRFDDGTEVALRKPVYRPATLAYGPLAEGAALSPRIAPQMIGLGLLEAIPASRIIARADPDDRDADGISGRAQIVWSRDLERPVLGRFGWKAGEASVREQSASAFSHDIGIANPVFPAPAGDCTAAQTDCLAAPDGVDAHGVEIDAEPLDLVTFYAQTLAPPARREADDPQVLRGEALFHQAGCAACHQPAHVTARLPDRPELSFQTIWPYTDLLLHDMGPGLADDLPEARAEGREWRTAPLWGIGLTETVSGHSYYLHDGRARGLLEAILWHGGEAEAAKARVLSMPEPDRAALLRFLRSL